MEASLVLSKDIIPVTDKGILVLQKCLDSSKDVPGSHSEAFPSSPHSGDQAVKIKVEEFSLVQDGEGPVPISFLQIKAEHEVSPL
jgi:hypothetical protein